MFGICDFDEMRDWIVSISYNSKVLQSRLDIFDAYRYSEDYESIYDFIRGLGGSIR